MIETPQTVLIVDDVDANFVMLDSVIAREGVSVVHAKNGMQALNLLKTTDVSLILLDVMMPEMDGYELAERIRETPKHQYIPILFVTGSEDEGDFRGYEVGAVDILYKPIQPEVIRHKVHVFLELDQQKRLIQRQTSELEVAIEKLTDYAHHDQLTGLFNRDQITSILMRLMANAQRSKSLIAVLFLDLDHFKTINDSLGHDVGDQLLQSTANRIKESIRRGDFVARLGGDEFAVILSELDSPESARLVASKILDKLVMPHQLEHHEVLVSASIGIAIYDDYSKGAQELFKAADAAMYQAKGKGRSQFAYYSEELERQASARIEIARSLNQAIDDDKLLLYYQPQIRAADQKLCGFEALLRWKHDGRFVSPAMFVPIAEETGLIPKLGAWVLKKACCQLKEWQDNELVEPSTRMAVNISNRQVQAENFLEVLSEALETSQLPPKSLELELTESTVMDDPEHVISIFNEVQKLGIDIAVDDFGTGYSSLNYLRRLPIDYLKIDQSFVSEIEIDPNDEAIVKAIIGLSHNLGLQVIAEGVETPEQLQFLRTHNCDIIQGYYFSQALPPEQIETYVKANLAS